MAITLNVNQNNSSGKFRGAIKQELEKGFIPEWKIEGKTISVSDSIGKFLEWDGSSGSHIVNEVEAETGVKTTITVDANTPSFTCSSDTGYQAVRIQNGQFIVFIPNGTNNSDMKLQVFTKSGNTLTYVKEIALGGVNNTLDIADHNYLRMAGNEQDNKVYVYNGNDASICSIDIVTETISTSVSLPTGDTTINNVYTLLKTEDKVLLFFNKNDTSKYLRFWVYKDSFWKELYVEDKNELQGSAVKVLYDPNNSKYVYTKTNILYLIKDLSKVVRYMPSQNMEFSYQEDNPYIRDIPSLKIDDPVNSYGIYNNTAFLRKVTIVRDIVLVALHKIEGNGVVLGYENIYKHDERETVPFIPNYANPYVLVNGEIEAIHIGNEIDYLKQDISIPFNNGAIVYDDIIYEPNKFYYHENGYIFPYRKPRSIIYKIV